MHNIVIAHACQGVGCGQDCFLQSLGRAFLIFTTSGNAQEAELCLHMKPSHKCVLSYNTFGLDNNFGCLSHVTVVMFPARGMRTASLPLLLLLLLPILASLNVVASFNRTYQNYKGTQTCRALKIFRPQTAQRVSQIVLMAKRNGLRVRAVGGRFSSNRIICTDGYALDMSRMNNVTINEKAMQVTVGAGAKLFDIHTALKNKGYSFKVSASQFSGKKQFAARLVIADVHSFFKSLLLL